MQHNNHRLLILRLNNSMEHSHRSRYLFIMVGFRRIDLPDTLLALLTAQLINLSFEAWIPSNTGILSLEFTC